MRNQITGSGTFTLFCAVEGMETNLVNKLTGQCKISSHSPTSPIHEAELVRLQQMETHDLHFRFLTLCAEFLLDICMETYVA